MRDRKVKVERYALWFSDLPGTAQMLGEKSEEGWHIEGFDVDTGKFTYRKGEPKHFYYAFAVNGGSDDLAIFQDDFETVCTATGLTLYRREEDGAQGCETVRQAFPGAGRAEEEAWLQEMARKGDVLLHADRPDYQFTMGEPAQITYRIDYREQVDDVEAYLAPFRTAGWTYVCGSRGYHYFCAEQDAPREKAPDEAAFAPERADEAISRGKVRQTDTFLFLAVAGLLGALVKLIYDVNQYGAGAGTVTPVWMDLAAGAICLVCLIACLVIRLRARRKPKGKEPTL